MSGQKLYSATMINIHGKNFKTEKKLIEKYVSKLSQRY